MKSITFHTFKNTEGGACHEATEGKIRRYRPVGEKGQIVIPKGARDLLNIRPGDTLLVLADEQRGIALTKDEVLFQQLEGFLSREEEP